jgi:alkanesulfonate monooxygenase SsuD/methylene tetrahydromethanopterin reductase-like flavin-dependent oxidoreductase (luciferase family)
VSTDSDVSVWFGLFLPQLRMSFGTILERTLTAEAAGFDSVWLMDHLAAPAAPEWDTLEGWTLAAGLATRTTRIRLGHLVTADPFRHPAVLAKMAATLDVLSDGRLERAGRLRETLEILPRMFEGEPFDYAGTHYQLEGARGRPVPTQPHIPVHIGGAGPKLTMPLVREFADWWNCPSYAADRLAELRPLAGSTRVSVQHPVGLAPGDTDRDEVEGLVQRRFGTWGGVVTGTPGDVAGALITDVELGARGFVLQFHDFGNAETLERFMTEVAPAVRAAAAR